MSDETTRPKRRDEDILRELPGITHDVRNHLNILTMASGLAGMELQETQERLRSACDALRRYKEREELSSIVEETIQAMEVLRSAQEHIGAVAAAARKGDNLLSLLFTPPEMRMLSLNDIVAEEVAYLRAEICRPPKCHLLYVTTATRPIYAHHTSMRRVVQNLVVNAVRAIEEHGSIIVRTSNTTYENDGKTAYDRVPAGPYTTLTVQDTGRGIAPESIPRLLDPEYSTKTNIYGGGRGLAIVRDIVTAHQGCIDVCSKEGEGTTFTIHFPALTPERIRAEVEAELPNTPSAPTDNAK